MIIRISPTGPILPTHQQTIQAGEGLGGPWWTEEFPEGQTDNGVLQIAGIRGVVVLGRYPCCGLAAVCRR